MKLLNNIMFLLIAAVGCVSNTYGEASREEKVNHYSFRLPSEFILKDVSPPMMDFDLYQIRKKNNDSVIVGLYFGNAPRFPIFKWKTLPQEEKVGNLTKRTFKYREIDGSIEGVLIFGGLSYGSSTQSPYTQVHYFAEGIDKKTAETLIEIISSLRVVEPHLE